MTTYNATATCHNLECTVVTYAHHLDEVLGTVPPCPACQLRDLTDAQREANGALRDRITRQNDALWKIGKAVTQDAHLSHDHLVRRVVDLVNGRGS